MRSYFRLVRLALASLQMRATALLSLVVLVATLFTGVLGLRIAAYLSVMEARRQSTELARAVAVGAAEPLRERNRETLLRMAADLTAHARIQHVVFADPTGEVLSGLHGGTSRIQHLMDGGQNRIRLKELNRPRLMTSSQAGACVDVVYPARAALLSEPGEPQGVVGYVRLGLSLTNAQAGLAALTRRMGGLSLGITLLMVPLGFEVVRRIVSPVNRLSEAARRLAAGDLAARVEVTRSDEIGELGRTFNGMADDLARSHTELLTLNAELEQRVRDRTRDLESANRLLRAEMDEKEDFVRAVSHDLSAPLRNVSGMADLLRRKLGPALTADAVRYLDRIDHNIRQELHLIDELLELSQIQRRGGVPVRVDLGQELASIAKQFEYELSAKNIRLIVEPPLPEVYGDRRRLRQLFQNLIDNAIKYTDPARRSPDRPPEIRVSCVNQESECVFRVADNGIGVPPEESEQIFRVFRRSRDGYVRNVSGKGVGLSCCKSIVQKQGGRIWVEANPKGGSVFCFTLPTRRKRPGAEPEPHAGPYPAEAAVAGGGP